MRPIRVLPMLFTAALLVQAVAHAAPPSRPANPRPAPPGSFTSLRVESFADLKSQVSHNRVVRQRYARFFHMPESAVPRFISTELYPVQLTRAQTCVVYFVSPTGKFSSHTIRLKPGSRVFALRAGGQPALNFVCGNAFLLPIKNKAFSVTDNPPDASVFGLDTPTDSLPELASIGPGYTATPVSTLVSPYAPITNGGGVSRLLPLAALGLLGIPTGHSSTPSVAVPEPSAAACLLAGIPVLGLAVRRRTGRSTAGTKG
jgi:hypothetical protein